jgi:hypothetical protein
MSRKRGRREDADRAVEIISAIMALLRQFVVYERRGKNDMLCTARNIIPEGSLGAVVMDATAGNSPVYDLMKAKRYSAIEGTRNYSNGTLHVGIAEQLGLRKMVENGKAKAAELMNDIKHRLPAVTPSGTRVFVTCHKDNRAHVAGHAHEFESMHVAHYGQIDGENGWKDCNHVVQFGLHYRADTDASGSFMAFEGTPKTAKWFSVTSWRSTG